MYFLQVFFFFFFFGQCHWYFIRLCEIGITQIADSVHCADCKWAFKYNVYLFIKHFKTATADVKWLYTKVNK